MMTNVEPIDNATARFQIGEVADRTGVTQRALRFYEERGLLRPPERMEGGFRLYSENDVSRIAYIRQLQNRRFDKHFCDDLRHKIISMGPVNCRSGPTMPHASSL